MAAATPEVLFEFLAKAGVQQRTLQHPPVFHVGEGADIKAALAGGHTKNLFLKDAKDRLWLVTALGETQVDLKSLPAHIGSGRLSFGSAALMGEVLGVQPGSVTPFALINDTERRVTLVLDAALVAEDLMNFHPLVNTATTQVSREGFLGFLAALGVEPIVTELSASDV